ncbi:MAG: hypothetical protein MUD12_15510 [Spirochaetes bacterium]|jgi:hypothetical protein|nr:hypothetical protein [Spirochaetota bacterium]
MKVSIDGILGSARRLSGQKQVDDDVTDKKKEEIKGDSLTLGGRINSRLDSIDREFREIQSSLTKNQIIKSGIEQLLDSSASSNDRQKILDNARFEGKPVLQEFVGSESSGDGLKKLLGKSAGLVDTDIERLKKLNVELDNIAASNLAGPDRTAGIASGIESLISSIGQPGIESISKLRPDTVMRLIK